MVAQEVEDRKKVSQVEGLLGRKGESGDDVVVGGKERGSGNGRN